VNPFALLLAKPHYVWRPRQALLRVVRAMRRTPDDATVTLPWGAALRICPSEDIGRSIWTTGVYDLVASEAIWRLLDPGETAVDVGANIGYFTSLMACRAGPTGTMLAAEPHPEIHRALAQNVEGLRAAGTKTAAVGLLRAALSDAAGRLTLWEPPEFVTNRGTARLSTDAAGASADGAGRRFEVDVVTLDDWCGTSRPAVLKLDVEGHELSVLRGAAHLLAARAIRDIVYEDHDPAASGIRAHLERHGFCVFALGQRITGPALLPPDTASPLHFAPPSVLATLQPERARTRLAPRGWKVLWP